ncbi:hypothetical protein CY34DRAFT_266679 [Suillus luteus UH-Slu-Lm8-n1]|uniref:Uncharacterized protein n=1 Tax=Suillus luteus UH-Slu-Lm8-n1 TaxID=930992 RepID=A0A0D0BWT6_9AGAM|nr:hypothetical protein CY34DRAFT_266679 [Suillus luteus UH-Slu-Lm8-n1]
MAPWNNATSWSRLASVSGCHVSVEERGLKLDYISIRKRGLLRKPTKGTISKFVVNSAATMIIGNRLRPGQTALS